VGGGLLSMNAFEPLFWMGCVFVLVRIVRTGNSRLWIWFGLLAGLGLLNKHSTLLFGFAVAVAIVLSPERRQYLNRWIWIGGAIAALVFLPNLIWQVTHGFPTLEDLENVRRTGKNIALNPLEFFGQQIFLLNPGLFPVWLAGIVSLMAGRGRRLRVLGWTYLVLLVTMIALKAKNYYLAPIYPMLFAAGAVAMEEWLARRAPGVRKSWPQAAILSYAVVAVAVMVPAVMPVLPPGRLVGYQRTLGVAPRKTEVNHSGPLPQFLGDQFGWPELVAEVARIYTALPPAERARTAIFANNYGEAGAINLFGPAHGLPRAISAHQTHFFWGPGDTDADNYIVLQSDPEELKVVCASVEEAGRHFHPWGMAEENRPIYLCRGLRTPIREMWPRLKHWN